MSQSQRPSNTKDVGRPKSTHEEETVDDVFAKTEPQSPITERKIQLTELECYDKLGFSYSTSRKWFILSIIFAVQVSMNFNASVYASAIKQVAEEFNITMQTARVGQMIFLIAYAFGSEFWAPWSEELGRFPVLQLSLFFVNIWQIPCGLAPNFATIAVGRFLGGLSSAGGSVTLGLIADMWEPEDQGYAVNFIVLSSVGGSVVGPIVGGYLATYMHWSWNFWVQLMLGAVVQALHFFCVPETRATLLVGREAKRRRKNGIANVYGPDELKSRMTMAEIATVWIRPFEMFIREPIVLWLSLLSGFSDSLIFTFLESFGPVFRQWGFSTVQIGLSFSTLAVAYVIAYISFFPFIRRHRAIARADPDGLAPEARLYWLLWTAPLETIGLFGFAWTSLGPPHVHWIAPLIFAGMVGVANFAIYMATIDYMVASYGPYAASATGGNALARDFLAGVAAMYSVPFYESIGDRYKLEWPTTILACLAFFIAMPIYIFYWNGPAIRKRSKFAQTLASERNASIALRNASIPLGTLPANPADESASANV